MDDRRALMAAIVANPDEDTPRLALADWLQEHGDTHDQARAEFIRLQCGLPVQGTKGKSKRSLESRANAIEKAHIKHWLGPLAEFEKYPSFERGLLAAAGPSTGVFLRKRVQQMYGDGLASVGANRFVLSGPTRKPDELASSPVLAWVPSLTWWNTQLDDAGMKALAKFQHTQRLGVLTIEKLRCSDSGLLALAKSSSFPALRRLRLLDPVYGGMYTAKGMRALIASDKFPLLDTFAFTSAYRVGLESFCNEPALSRLKRLHVRESRPFTHLCRCQHLTGLEELSIESYNAGMTDADAFTLLDNPGFAKLRRFAIEMPRLRAGLSDTALKRLHKRFGEGFSTEPDLRFD
jgi:uncharacterized protein (TIGR02996 family)